MEYSSFSHQGGAGYPTESRDSHWLPALRPDADGDKIQDDTILQKSETQSNQATEDMDLVRVNTVENETRTTEQAWQSIESSCEDDQRLDPAWGIKRSDSAQLLNNIHRSSSFPKPIERQEGLDPHEGGLYPPGADVDYTTFEALVNGAAEIENIDGNTAVMTDQEVVMGSEQRQDEDDDNSNTIFTQTQDGRYEEGVPLIDSHLEPLTEHESSFTPSALDAFDSVDVDEEASFFSDNRQAANESALSPALNRKSTSDVLKALDPTSERRDDSPTALANTSGGEAISNAFTSEPSFSAALMPDTIPPPQEADDKWAAVLDDDEFLVEDADDLLPDSEPESPDSFGAMLKRDDGIPNMSQKQSNLLTDEGATQSSNNPSTFLGANQPNLPSNHASIGLNRPALAPIKSFQSQLQQQPSSTPAQSFADKAKGGYASPYDMPLELAKPKKRPQTQRLVSQTQKGMPPPPPRSSSMSSEKQLQSPFTPTNQTFGPAVTSPPPYPSTPGMRFSSAPGHPSPSLASKPSSSGFFEELPIVSKPRPTPGAGRYTPVHGNTIMAPPAPPAASHTTVPTQTSVPAVQPLPAQISQKEPYPQFGLNPPERLDPYANTTLQAPGVPSAAVSSRYSPAPTSAQAPYPVPSARYSPAPPIQASTGPGRYASQPVSTPAVPPSAAGGNRYSSQPASAPAVAGSSLPFQPRTSSPLANSSRAAIEQNTTAPPPLIRAVSSTAVLPLSPPTSGTLPRSSAPSNPAISTLMQNPQTSSPPVFQPPKRSQTQSPSRQMARPTFAPLTDSTANRPASAYGTLSPTKLTFMPDLTSPPRMTAPGRVAFEEIDYIRPTDATQNDPLERWKGSPVFKFGFGGSVVTSFPKHTPRYSAGMMKPQIKSSAGEVNTRKAENVLPQSERASTFPGPLRNKSKKKDVLTWLTTAITDLEGEAPRFLGAAQTLPDPRKRHEEKIYLWKLVKSLVEHDGNADHPNALKAFNTILAPEFHAIDESTASQNRPDIDQTGIYRPAGSVARSDTVDPLAMETLRKHLMKGKREDAIWHAVDHRLWSHALLIASTIEPSIWKQVVQEFVRQEVKTIGNNAESLSALYEIFGGNVEESIDQLVPPSARAGLRMVSKAETSGPAKNALEGLDRWKETLVLVLNNRSREDYRALMTLANLLRDYGRVEAAQICYLFSRSPAFPFIFGGTDDPQACITLLGVDHRLQPLEFHHDQDAVLLTEVFEFATTVLSPVPGPFLPHLSVYKLYRAESLTDLGKRTEAQAYCEAIVASLRSNAKTSPYYHPMFLTHLDELSDRLKQIPVQNSSWITKPKIEKVSGSIFSKFTNFVAGEDSDAESKTSGKDGNNDVGPFANVSGSPNLSRSGSQTDLYGSYPAASAAIATTAAASRYAPNGLNSTRSSTELTRGRPSLDSQRSPPSTSYGHESKQSMYAPSFQPTQQNQSPVRSVNSYAPLGTSPSRILGSSPSFYSHPSGLSQSSYPQQEPLHQPSLTYHDQSTEDHAPSPILQDHTASDGYPMPSLDVNVPPSIPLYDAYSPGGFRSDEPQTSEDPIAKSAQYDQSQGYGYEPPADTGYQPYQPEPESEEESDKQKKTKKKSFMDDDDDDISYSQAPRPDKSTSYAPVTGGTTDEAAKKKANDEAADAAFRAAAEADAAQAKEEAAKKKSAGWFGGWLGGKKPDASLDSKASGGAEPKVHRANLGENKMKLYYDKDLKKWVNPDDPNSAKAKGSTPPPPRIGGTPAPPMGGPPRAGNTPAPPLSRSSTPASTVGVPPSSSDGIASTLPASTNISLGLSGGPPPSTNSSAPTSGGPLPSLAPPSRPASNASSIDDLLGPASGGARKGARGGKKAGKGRYVDVMAQ